MLPGSRNSGTALQSLLGMSREMDRLVGSMWPQVEQQGFSVLPTEVIETDDEVRFDIEMPGFRLEDIEITLENNVLSIAGEKKMQREENRDENDYRLFERRYGRYQRSFTVPPTVRGDQCEADYENGVLSIRLPKSEEAKPRRIQVRGAAGGRQVGQGSEG